MNAVELAAKIQLHPRATVLLGTIEPRMKNAGALPGLMPHYAKSGCPVVQYNGANAVPEASAAEIEFSFQESAFPLPRALEGYSPRQGNLVQLMYGRNGQAPTQGAYRVLREASAIISKAVDSKRDVFLVSLPIMTPGQYGVTNGRHYLLGVFGTDGTAIYVNPEAVEQRVLKADFPTHQQERSIGADVTPAPAIDTNWYVRLSSTLATATGLKLPGLHDVVIRARAQELVDQGHVTTLDAGLARANEEAPRDRTGAPTQAKTPATAPATPAAPPERSTRALGAQARGRAIASAVPPAMKTTAAARDRKR